MFKITLTDTANLNSKVMFRTETLYHAEQIVKAMNALNVEAAKISGKMIRFVYTIVTR